jgi:hypothetical protein
MNFSFFFLDTLKKQILSELISKSSCKYEEKKRNEQNNDIDLIAC